MQIQKGKPIQLDIRNQIILGFLICVGMFGNGVKTFGMLIMTAHRRMVLLGLMEEIRNGECYEAARGAVRVAYVVLRSVSIASPTPSTSALVFEL